MEDGCKMCTLGLAYKYLTKSVDFNRHKCHENIQVTLEIKSRISINLGVKRRPIAIGWYSKYMEDL